MFVGRDKELDLLNKAYSSNKRQFVVIYGRRRIGKTYLIQHFIADKKAIYYLAQQSTSKINLRYFSQAINDFEGASSRAPFLDFYSALKHVFDLSLHENIVLVLDEFPWLVDSEKSLPSLLQGFLDNHVYDKCHLFLILCGSSINMMEENVLSEKSPLFEHETLKLKMFPFSFAESRLFLTSFSLEDQLALYAVTNGIGQYLSYIDPSLSFAENINALFFSSTGRLYDEPSTFLKAELKEPGVYSSIITAIANGATKPNEIATKCSLPSNKLSYYLSSLQTIGLVKKEESVLPQSGRKPYYYLTDFLFVFYYRNVVPFSSLIERGQGKVAYSMSMSTFPSFLGQVFEEVCQQWINAESLKGKMPFVYLEAGRWWGHNPTLHQEEEIDFVAAGKDDIILAECKYRNESTDLSVYKELQRKGELIKGYKNVYYWFFSKSNFSSSLKEEANKDNHIRLIRFQDMFK
jgi:AAA+ ATPase superfamily predicted ATPase